MRWLTAAMKSRPQASRPAGLPLTIVPATGDGSIGIQLEGPPQTSNPDGTFRLEAKAGPSALVVLTPPQPVSTPGPARPHATRAAIS